MLVALGQLNVRTQQFRGYLLEALIQLGPEDFLYRAFGPWHALLINTCDGAHLVQPHDLDIDKALGQLLPHYRVFRSRSAVPLDGVRELDQPIELALENDLHAGAERGALMHERSNGDVPAVAHLAEDVLNGHADIAEEKLTEFAFACHLPQRPDFHAGAFHVH